MEKTKWKIRNRVYSFPKDWNKQKVLQYCNQSSIRVCELCGKIDVGLNHYDDCNPAMEAQRQQMIQDYYN